LPAWTCLQPLHKSKKRNWPEEYFDSCPNVNQLSLHMQHSYLLQKHGKQCIANLKNKPIVITQLTSCFMQLFLIQVNHQYKQILHACRKAMASSITNHKISCQRQENWLCENVMFFRLQKSCMNWFYSQQKRLGGHSSQKSMAFYFFEVHI
jgi:hypothetical protein